MSLSLIAVFIPILMMPGIIGTPVQGNSPSLFSPFRLRCRWRYHLTTHTPMMCSRLLKVRRTHGRFYNWTEKFFQWDYLNLCGSLQTVLGHPAPVLFVMLATTVGITGYLYVKIPKGIFPAAAGHRAAEQRSGAGPATYFVSGTGGKGQVV